MKIISSRFRGRHAEIVVAPATGAVPKVVVYGPFGPLPHEKQKDPIVANTDLAIKEIGTQCGEHDDEVRRAVAAYLTRNDNPL